MGLFEVSVSDAHRPACIRNFSPSWDKIRKRPRGGVTAVTEPEKAVEPVVEDDNIDDLRRQMKEMQERLERMSKEPKKEE